ncbi:MAG: hypothetical protein ACR2PL_02340, partial [Dehalococcoidia bacterium]
YYVVRVTAQAIHNRNWEPDEHRFLVGHHWWSLDEISRSDEIFVPRRLGELLPPILTCHYPSEPIEVGV